MIRAARWLMIALSGASSSGCIEDSHTDVAYSSNRNTFGEWPSEARPGRPANGGAPADKPVPGRPTADSGSDPEQDADLDSGVERADAGRFSDAALDAMAQPGTPATPDAQTTSGQARLRFSVLTHVQHMRLRLADPDFDDDARGPKNMGAIWITKPDGSFVRSLEVWRRHKERARHLVAYNEACECPQPDVVASATLEMHKQHVVTWDMTDRDGSKVAEGEYMLFVEVADYDVANEDRANLEAKNALLRVELDTRDAPRELPVETSEFFSGARLELFAP